MVIFASLFITNAMTDQERINFGSKLGVVAAAAGSAVGLVIYGDSRMNLVNTEVALSW